MRGCAVALCLILPLPALAQTPPDAGSLLRQQEQQQQKAVPQKIPEAQQKEPSKPDRVEDAGVKVQTKSIRFTGAVDLVPEAELGAAVAEAVGQTLGFNDLEALADKVTKYLRDAGWLLARAYLPRQDVSEGVIEIAIIKGHLAGSQGEGGGWQIHLSEKSRINKGTLTAIAEKNAPSGTSPKEKQLERALFLINDLPGISARSRLAPGKEKGATQVTVDVEEAPLLTGILWADNYGNHSTGKAQANALINVNDPFGYGDHAIVSGAKSKGIRLLRLGYDLPLNSSGLRAAVGYTTMDYEVIDGSGRLAELAGDSHIVNAGISFPFIRGRLFNVFGGMGYEHKALRDKSSAGTLRDKRVNVVNLSLSADYIDRWGGGGVNHLGGVVTSGDLDLSRVASDKEVDAATLNTDGHYHKFSLNASRLQRLSDRFTLLGRFSAQWASSNLDSSEEFILGGPNGVRAYPVAEAQGDEGWLGSVELRYDWPRETRLGLLQLSAFIDTGRIRVHHDPGDVAIPTATGKNSYQLNGAGIGVHVSRSGSHSVRMGWAHMIGHNDGRTIDGKNADGETDKSRFWLQGVVWF